MATRNFVFPFCAAILTVILVYKFRVLRARWSNARLWALCSCILFFALTMWSASPASARWINRVAGVPNIAELLAAAGLTAVAASFMSLALLWRYPTAQAWPGIRRVVLAYALVIIVMAVLFSVSEVPVERTVDFTFYYADHPTIAASYSINYLATLTGSAVLARWCFGWAGHPDYAGFSHLRRGLRLYAGTALVLVVYSLVRLVTMGANWFGTEAVNSVGTGAALICSLVGCFLLTAALVIPVWGPRWQRWSRFLSLWSLHRALQEVNPAVLFVAPGRRLDLQHRIRRTMIELSDWRWTLAPLFDPAVPERVRRLGTEAGLTAEQLTTTVEAAQLRAALQAWRQGARPADRPPNPQDPQDERDGNDAAGELDWWSQVARAFHRSAIVKGTVTAPTRPRSLIYGRLGRR